MKKQHLFALIVTLISGINPSFSQQTFPELTGKTLEDKSITLPLKNNGNYTLVGIAYSKKAEDQLKTWFQPVYNTFIQKSGKTLFPTENYNVTIYFIPMITGIAQSAGGKIENKMKENIDKSLQPYVLVYEGEVKNYKTSLNMTEKDQPYFFVLDPKGHVVYTCTGSYTEGKFEKILEIVEDF